MQICFDIEADELLPKVSKVHVLHAVDMVSGERFNYLEGDFGWIDLFKEAEFVMGHNVINYDFAVLNKLFKYTLPTDRKKDSLLFSQIMNYRRFGNEGHSLERWGQFFGFHKIPFHDFSKYTPEMQEYVERDVDLNIKIWEVVKKEYDAIRSKTPKIEVYVNAEHYAGDWNATASVHGWKFDKPKALELFEELEHESAATTAQIEPRLGFKAVIKDRLTPAVLSVAETPDEMGIAVDEVTGETFEGTAEIKRPKFTKFGSYAHHTANWFGLDIYEGCDDDRTLVGPFCRVAFEPLKLSSSQDVKIFLYRNGWKPLEWNVKKQPDGKRVRTSPKITLESIEFMGGDAKLYMDYLTVNSRYGILKGWLANLDENDRLHGDAMLIGTPSMRARHSIIVNVPSADAKYGAEMRALFINEPGWVLIGADSAGNQARGLAHYLKDAEFTDIILNGDIHTYDANKLTDSLMMMLDEYTKDESSKKKLDKLLEKMEIAKQRSIEDLTGSLSHIESEEERQKVLSKIEELKATHFKVPRKSAKRVLYAFLFGAAGAKLWSYIFGEPDDALGKDLKAFFESAIPGFKSLVDKLKSFYNKTQKEGIGWFPSIAGNRVYVDSQHKLLVYLLQSAEKATCSGALMYTVQELQKEGIPYIPLIYYHDEIDFAVPEQYAERAAEIAKAGFKEAPKWFGIQIMDGEAKIGKSWLEVH